MRVLLDECLPAALRETVNAMGHECQTVRKAGYGSKKNGELLALAEGRWDILLTSDRRIKYQQNMTGRSVSIVILRAKSNRMQDLAPLMPDCAEPFLPSSLVKSSKLGNKPSPGVGDWPTARKRAEGR